MDSNRARRERATVSVYLSPDQKKQLDAAATEARMTRQRLIRGALRRLFADLASGVLPGWRYLADWYAVNPVKSAYLDRVMPVRSKKGGKK